MLICSSFLQLHILQFYFLLNLQQITIKCSHISPFRRSNLKYENLKKFKIKYLILKGLGLKTDAQTLLKIELQKLL